MTGNLDIAGNVFLAGSNVGKDGRKQIVGAHALNLRRNFLAALESQQGQRTICIPAPPRAKDWRSARRLYQDVLHSFGTQEMKNVGQRKAVLLGECDVDTVIRGSGLQFEIETAAKAFAQRQAPGFVDASTKGCVDD